MFKTLVSLGKIGSRIVSFGATRGPVPNLLLPSMTVKEMSVIGSTMGSPQDFADMVKFVEEHRIHPVLDKTYSLEEAPEALFRMEKGENFGKIVLSIPQDLTENKSSSTDDYCSLKKDFNFDLSIYKYYKYEK